MSNTNLIQIEGESNWLIHVIIVVVVIIVIFVIVCHCITISQVLVATLDINLNKLLQHFLS